MSNQTTTLEAWTRANHGGHWITFEHNLDATRAKCACGWMSWVHSRDHVDHATSLVDLQRQCDDHYRKECGLELAEISKEWEAATPYPCGNCGKERFTEFEPMAAHVHACVAESQRSGWRRY